MKMTVVTLHAANIIKFQEAFDCSLSNKNEEEIPFGFN